jgi:hypothetical protein
VQGELGSWDFKSKRKQGIFCPEGLCRAHMFALAVTEQLDTWPEQHARQRQWVRVVLIITTLLSLMLTGVRIRWFGYHFSCLGFV